MVKRKQPPANDGRKLNAETNRLGGTKQATREKSESQRSSQDQRLRRRAEEDRRAPSVRDDDSADEGSGEESESSSSEQASIRQGGGAAQKVAAASKAIGKDNNKKSRKGDYIYDAIKMMKGANHIHKLDKLIQEKFNDHLQEYQALCQKEGRRSAIVKRIGKIRNYWRQKNTQRVSQRTQPTRVSTQAQAAVAADELPPQQHHAAKPKQQVSSKARSQQLSETVSQNDEDEEDESMSESQSEGQQVAKVIAEAAAADDLLEEEKLPPSERAPGGDEMLDDNLDYEDEDAPPHYHSQSVNHRNISLLRDRQPPSQQHDESQASHSRREHEILQQLTESNAALEKLKEELSATHEKLIESTQVQKDLLENNQALARSYNTLSGQFDSLTAQLQAMNAAHDRNSQDVLAQLRQQEQLIRKSKPSQEEEKKEDGASASNNSPVDINNTIENQNDMMRSYTGLPYHLYQILVREKLETYEATCSICLGPFIEKQNVITLYCNPLHRLHQKCAFIHFLQNNYCPLCKENQTWKIAQHEQRQQQTRQINSMRSANRPQSQAQQSQLQMPQFPQNILQNQVPAPAAIHTGLQSNPQAISDISATSRLQQQASIASQQQPPQPQSLIRANWHELLSPVRRPVPQSPNRISPPPSPRVPTMMRMAAGSNVSATMSIQPGGLAQPQSLSAFRQVNQPQNNNAGSLPNAINAATATAIFNSRQYENPTVSLTDTVQMSSSTPPESEISISEDSNDDGHIRQSNSFDAHMQCEDSDPLTDDDGYSEGDQFDNRYLLNSLDMNSLTEDNWLNDQTIDAFVFLLRKRMHLQNLTDVYPFSVSAFRQLLGQNPLRRPFKQVLEMKATTLLFPVNVEEVHWGLVVVYTDQHLAYIVDSNLTAIQDPNDSSIDVDLEPSYHYDEVLEGVKFAMNRFYTLRYQHSNNRELVANAPNLASSDVTTLMSNIRPIQFAAQQQNDYDCGIFLCINLMVLCYNSGDTSFLSYISDNDTMTVLRKYLRHDIMRWTKRSCLWDKFLELNTQASQPRRGRRQPTAALMNRSSTAGASAAATPQTENPAAALEESKTSSQAVQQSSSRQATTAGDERVSDTQSKKQTPQQRETNAGSARSHFDVSFRKQENSDDEKAPNASQSLNYTGAVAASKITPGNSKPRQQHLKHGFKEVEPPRVTMTQLQLKKMKEKRAARMMGSSDDDDDDSEQSSSEEEEDSGAVTPPGRFTRKISTVQPSIMNNSRKSSNSKFSKFSKSKKNKQKNKKKH